VSEIMKMFFAVGLLAAGFFCASLFGSPDAGDGVTITGDEWSPQRLEPVDNRELVPSSASATWDQNIALATHTDSDRSHGAGEQRFIEHQTARPEWVDRTLEPLPGTDVAVPEIRSQATTSINRSPTAQTAWPDTQPLDDDRLASLAPPPLLTTDTARAMRPSRFPDRPENADGAATAMAPAPSNSPAVDSQSFGQAGFAAPGGWNTPAPLPATQSPIPNTALSEPIWHVVADGDSLPKIAERYLRDAARAREIFDLNRDVLTNPDLLPIGTELRIPQRAAAPAQFEVFDASGTQSSSFRPQSRLVPLPELPASVRAVPRARLQAPVSASLAAGP
jgi:LysM repeat protein